MHHENERKENETTSARATTIGQRLVVPSMWGHQQGVWVKEAPPGGTTVHVNEVKSRGRML